MYRRRATWLKAHLLLPALLSNVSIVWNPPGWGSAHVHSLLSADVPIVPGTWRLVTLFAMKPGGYIPFHSDRPASENAIDAVLTRFHLVLATNERCWNYHAGDWRRLEEGGLYEMDPTQEHASINFGDTTRYHLVIDTEIKGAS